MTGKIVNKIMKDFNEITTDMIDNVKNIKHSRFELNRYTADEAKTMKRKLISINKKLKDFGRYLVLNDLLKKGNKIEYNLLKKKMNQTK